VDAGAGQLSSQPPSLTDLLAARAGEARLRQVITDRWEITGERSHKVPTMQVYTAMGDFLKRSPAGRPVQYLTMQLVRDLGGMYLVLSNRRFFAGLADRDADLVPGRRPGNPLQAIAAAWNRRLAEEGMGEEPAELSRRSKLGWRAAINLAVLDRMRRDYWQRQRALDVWRLYAVDGLGEDTIAAQTGIHKSTVHRIVAAEKARMNRPVRKRGSMSDAEEIGAIEVDDERDP
jgi:hypothetical protein